MSCWRAVFAPVGKDYSPALVHRRRGLQLAGGTVEGVTSATAEYAPYVEEGTSVRGPQPFMPPAFARNVPLFEQALQQLLGEVLD